MLQTLMDSNSNEISSVTSNSTQTCRTINDKVQEQMKVLWTLNMQVLVCNNTNFWEIEINGFIKIPNFGDNKNFYFEYKMNLLSF
jgi:hypothetical protein